MEFLEILNKVAYPEGGNLMKCYSHLSTLPVSFPPPPLGRGGTEDHVIITLQQFKIGSMSIPRLNRYL